MDGEKSVDLKDFETAECEEIGSISTLEEIERLKVAKFTARPESEIVDSIEYKALKARFSVLDCETMRIRKRIDESNDRLKTLGIGRVNHIDALKIDEIITTQKESDIDAQTTEHQMSKLREENEMLKGQYEQMVAANEKTRLLNREMMLLITSMQSYNTHLKNQANRYKRHYQRVDAECTKLKKDVEDMKNELCYRDVNGDESARVEGSGLDMIQEGEGHCSTNAADTSEYDRQRNRSHHQSSPVMISSGSSNSGDISHMDRKEYLEMFSTKKIHNAHKIDE